MMDCLKIELGIFVKKNFLLKKRHLMKFDFTKEEMIVKVDKDNETVINSKNVNIGIRL